MNTQGSACLIAADGRPFAVSPATLKWEGNGLVRPECVLATAAGDLFAADWRGGVAHIHPDGSQAGVAAMRAKGFTSIIAEIRADSPVSLAFYARHGFVETSRLDRIADDGRVMPKIVRTLILQEKGQ